MKAVKELKTVDHHFIHYNLAKQAGELVNDTVLSKLTSKIRILVANVSSLMVELSCDTPYTLCSTMCDGRESSLGESFSLRTKRRYQERRLNLTVKSLGNLKTPSQNYFFVLLIVVDFNWIGEVLILEPATLLLLEDLGSIPYNQEGKHNKCPVSRQRLREHAVAIPEISDFWLCDDYSVTLCFPATTGDQRPTVGYGVRVPLWVRMTETVRASRRVLIELITAPAKVNYAGTLLDGTQFDYNRDRESHSNLLSVKFYVEFLSCVTVKDICKDGGKFKKIVKEVEKWENPKDLDEITKRTTYVLANKESPPITNHPRRNARVTHPIYIKGMVVVFCLFLSSLVLIGFRSAHEPQPAWDGLRRMRGQARKTTGLPIRRQMAPRDEPDTVHEVGESSQQAEFRAQLRQVTLDLQGTRLELQESRAIGEDTRTTVFEILTYHLLLMEQMNALDAGSQVWRAMIEERMRRTMIQGMIAAFWQRVIVMMGVLEGMSLEARLLCVAIGLVIIAMVLDGLWYFLR
ncbi:hypothetical protein E3N88_22647 [Mikania micrantha]|uniref:Uncharacterized protein n=1 Tax=Mikania micrantha TaxID=192012 RepID=A0A5N6NB00_9ASTR|nr:hypothetical protein E3N88_22647 [Mikania micrantha]